MLRETALFDALQSELAIVLDEIQDDESNAERLATLILENEEARRLLIGVTEGVTAVLTYNCLMTSITRTPIDTDGLMATGISISTANGQKDSVEILFFRDPIS